MRTAWRPAQPMKRTSEARLPTAVLVHAELRPRFPIDTNNTHIVNFGKGKIPGRKERVKTMKYEKPQITRVAPATDAIQNPLNKEVLQILDSQEELSSAAAYTADE